MNRAINALMLLVEQNQLEYDASFAIVQYCSQLLCANDELKNAEGRKILIHALDNWHKIPVEHHILWTDLVEAAGFYPYLKRHESVAKLSTAQRIRYETHGSSNLREVYFHEEQKQIKLLLRQKKNVIVSAPTSFGKSLLIEDIVASKAYKNIVIIQPTLALLDETRRKLRKYDSSYKIIVKTSQEVSDDERGNLFLLTAERVMEYPTLPPIDFFIIDEFYKLSAKRDDERSDVLNNAFHTLLKYNAGFYLLGPNIDGISEGFAEKYNATFFKTSYSLVENNEVDIYSKHKDKFDHPIINKGYKEKILFNLLVELSDSQTIIYCSSPERARKLALGFCDYVSDLGIAQERDLSIVPWIKENIHTSWSMIRCLKLGIGVHDGALPKHMTSSVIKYFNEEKIRFLFCTSTIIEGVNTSAKNVVFFDPNKGRPNNKVDFFDYSNIRGRAGRLMQHYVGTVYNFNKPPKKEKTIVDIPFFDQKYLSKEVLIHLDDEEVLNKSSKDYVTIKNIVETEKKVIKKNGLSVDGQQAILEILRKDIISKPDTVLWSGTPTYDQLSYLINLAWQYLVKPSENVRPFTASQMTKITFDYGFGQDINLLIRNKFLYDRKQDRYKDFTDEQVLDSAIRYAFQVLRHWFSYKIPKWLQTLDKLQKYVAFEKGIKPGDYSFYASQIENDFIRPNLTILEEYGIPRSAIKKLESIISEDASEETVFDLIREIVTSKSSSFNSYELELLKDLLAAA